MELIPLTESQQREKLGAMAADSLSFVDSNPTPRKQLSDAREDNSETIIGGHERVVRRELKALTLRKTVGNFTYTEVVTYEVTSISWSDCKPHSSLIADISSGDTDSSSLCSLLFLESLVPFLLEEARSSPGPQPLYNMTLLGS